MDYPGLDMSTTLGPVYWGTVISLVLGGITVLQAYIYFPHPSDRLFIQLTAGSMVVFDFVSSALVAQSVYYYTVPHFGSVVPLASITPELSAECLLSTIITFISQLYFVIQINAVTKTGRASRIIPISVGLFSILAFVFGVACTSVMFIFHHNVLDNREEHFERFFGLAKGFGALTDIIATIAMCKLLSDSKTGITSTHSLLKSLIRFIVHRGVLVTLIQTLLLITFYAVPSNLAWLAFHVNVTKLYANTFFAMLNARERLKERYTPNTTSITNFSQGRLSTKQAAASNKQMDTAFQDACDDGGSFPMHAMPTVTKTVLISDL
ncbi:hypothetical protein PC9H_002532 [Pleurotus ostreatus]|uniref:DUF6534 domain-containing protein n=1 Tax=Pleurotus ostreatus TaxID=5322 RepID=A0A8H6ZGW5_PLEOS|nr:uncharacterized protein PC9H_002532 [Pleurotus ostreatus]KAF7416267.1 hypothetical protein PC9H_002532 [Pleurotus ostreatus]KAJ8689137.1 hypothetical protein PTI98_013191 [Pleurotus ostreatus]